MKQGRDATRYRIIAAAFALVAVIAWQIAFSWHQSAAAVTLTQSGSLNVTATVLPNTPTDPAFIDQPQDNSHVTTTPLVVLGRCTVGLTVRIFNNGALAGSVACASDGTYTANITLAIGKNVLTVFNVDSFDQSGPASAAVTVFVDSPVQTTGNPVAASQILQAVGNDTAPSDQTNNPSDGSERLFEGSVVEPIAKLLDINTQVAPSTNATISTVANVAFVGSFLLLFILLAL